MKIHREKVYERTLMKHEESARKWNTKEFISRTDEEETDSSKQESKEIMRK